MPLNFAGKFKGIIETRHRILLHGPTRTGLTNYNGQDTVIGDSRKN